MDRRLELHQPECGRACLSNIQCNLRSGDIDPAFAYSVEPTSEEGEEIGIGSRLCHWTFVSMLHEPSGFSI